MSLLNKKPYLEQLSQWPRTGRHIMANYDENQIVVYQAYRPEIGHYAAKHQQFGGTFSYSRMSWIKPNFLWMMYRSGWGTKEGQEVILAITITKTFFDEILSLAVPSSLGASGYESQEEWKSAVAKSDVRLQWDPDHAPNGASQERRAIQLGLRGEILSRFGKEEIIAIEDISPMAQEQREHLHDLNKLLIPAEAPYWPESNEARKPLGLDQALSPTNQS